MSVDQADPARNANGAADLGPNHKVPGLGPNHRDPALGLNRKVPDPEQSHKALGLEPSHKVPDLPNRPGLRRAHRGQRSEELALYQRQAQIRMPAPGRTVLGYSGQGSARADLATAVVLIQLDAAANSSLLQSILGTGSSSLYVCSGSILTDSVPILAEQRVPAHSFYAHCQVKTILNIVSCSH